MPKVKDFDIKLIIIITNIGVAMLNFFNLKGPFYTESLRARVVEQNKPLSTQSFTGDAQEFIPPPTVIKTPSIGRRVIGVGDWLLRGAVRGTMAGASWFISGVARESVALAKWFIADTDDHPTTAEGSKPSVYEGIVGSLNTAPATKMITGLAISLAFLPLTYVGLAKMISSVAPLSVGALTITSMLGTGIISLFAAEKGLFKYTYKLGKSIGGGIHKGLYIPRKIAYGVIKHSLALLAYATAAVAMYQLVKQSGVLNNSLTPNGQARIDDVVNDIGGAMAELVEIPLAAAKEIGTTVANVAVTQGPSLLHAAGKNLTYAFNAAKPFVGSTFSGAKALVDVSCEKIFGPSSVKLTKM